MKRTSLVLAGLLLLPTTLVAETLRVKERTPVWYGPDRATKVMGSLDAGTVVVGAALQRGEGGRPLAVGPTKTKQTRTLTMPARLSSFRFFAVHCLRLGASGPTLNED